jgi:hypothetical protein
MCNRLHICLKKSFNICNRLHIVILMLPFTLGPCQPFLTPIISYSTKSFFLILKEEVHFLSRAPFLYTISQTLGIFKVS